MALLSLPAAAPAAMLATDNASNYASWTDGSNGGTGFGAWNLTNNNNNGTTLFSGYFLGDSTAGSGNINGTGGTSFAMYANPNGAFAVASRAFGGGALTLGQTFSIQLAVNFRNGGKGINLLSGTTQVFNFNVGGDDYNYKTGTSSTVSTGYAYSATSIFTISYNQTTATAGMFTISRAGDAPISQTFTASGVTSFQLYNSNTGDGGAQNNLYFNNLSVVPEPSAIALVAVGLTGLVVARRRRN